VTSIISGPTSRATQHNGSPGAFHVREAMTPLIDHLEGSNRTPADPIVSEVLQSFDAEGVNRAWIKALERRHVDPEGAITSARTLLETVCKRVLDQAGIEYSDKDDLPALYRAVATKLKIAPSQHTEETFRRILGGATSVVEGLGSLRNKIGDAHGQGKKLVRPSARHAQLAVNMAGTMATFIVETWNGE
jgi:Abortive infection C-terminus